MEDVAELLLPIDVEDEAIDGDEAALYWFSPSSLDGETRRRRHQIPSDTDSDANCWDEEARFGLDLFDRGSLLQEMDPFPDADPFGFGVFDGVEEKGSDYPELGPALGLRFGVEDPREEESSIAALGLDDDEGSDSGGDGFLVGRRNAGLGSGSRDGEPSRSLDRGRLRVVGVGSDSDSDGVEVLAAMSPRSGGRNVPNRAAGDLALPLCWDCLRIEEDRRDPIEDLEWEEVDVRVDERDFLNMVMDADENSSILPIDSAADLEIGEGGHEETAQNIEWEVLLAMNNLERNALIEPEDAQSYLDEDHDGYVYASEYEIMFGQFADHETSVNRSPPAAKSVVERLPSVVLTQVDVANNNTLCAVCKDEISLEEEVKQLPCFHHYHAECILPWLKIQNTCPVCRYELPTNDPDYESWRAQRAGRGGHAR